MHGTYSTVLDLSPDPEQSKSRAKFGSACSCLDQHAAADLVQSGVAATVIVTRSGALTEGSSVAGQCQVTFAFTWDSLVQALSLMETSITVVINHHFQQPLYSSLPLPCVSDYCYHGDTYHHHLPPPDISPAGLATIWYISSVLLCR